MSKNILILGTSGLIAPELSKKFLDLEYNVDIAGRNRPSDSRLTFFAWDLYKPLCSDLYNNLRKAYEAIIVSAWSGNEAGERDDFKQNMKCTSGILDTIKEIIKYTNVNQIVLLGSQAEYGSVSGVVDETYKVNESTLSAYGKAKLLLYKSVRKLDFKGKIVELRFHSVYGSNKKSQMLIDVISKMRNNENIIDFYSDGLHLYNFLYYKDAVAAIYHAIKNRLSGIYNIGSSKSFEFIEYINELSDLFNYKGKIVWGNMKSNNFLFDSNKFRTETNWSEQYSFKEGVEDVVSDFEIEELKKYNVIIYGAGYCGLFFSDLLIDNGITPINFFDLNVQKNHKVFNEIEITFPYSSKSSNDLVIICILNKNYFESIKQNLISLGYRNVINIYEIRHIKKIFEKQPLIFNVPHNWDNQNIDRINEVISYFEDTESIVLYKNILKNICCDYNTFIQSYPFSKQYLAYNIFKRYDKEVFIDCGAFRGDVLKYFIIANNGIYDKYIAIEPDQDNYKRIIDLNIYSKDKCIIVKKALSDKKEILKMKNYLNENSVVCEKGFEVEADALDNICENNNIIPTFIKVDVEGFEEKLIYGAYHTITKYQPLIAIAVYHKYDDLWKIPKIIKKYLPNHKLFLRSYMNVNETILYAVPEWRLLK